LGDVLDAESLEASRVHHVVVLDLAGALEGVLESDTERIANAGGHCWC
jgi:hypothetical protein